MAPRGGFGEEIWVRERVAFTIMVAILIFLFALTFAVLGKGEYEPSVPSGEQQGAVPSPVSAWRPGLIEHTG
jgi:hypothetical protein